MKKHLQSFTLIELVIVIAIISIISAILIPKLINSYQNSKENIIDIYNNNNTIKVYCDDELIFEGSHSDMPDLSEYELIDVYTENSCIIMKMTKNELDNN